MQEIKDRAASLAGLALERDAIWLYDRLAALESPLPEREHTGPRVGGEPDPVPAAPPDRDVRGEIGAAARPLQRGCSARPTE